MNKNLVYILISVFVVILLGLFIYTKRTDIGVKTSQHIFSINKNNIQSNSINSLPAQLNENFDPSTNSIVAKINEVDLENETISMQIVFPKSMVDMEINSKISCKNNDFIIVQDKSNQDSVTKQEFLNRASLSNPLSDLVSGICNDYSCTQLVSKCKLIISSK